MKRASITIAKNQLSALIDGVRHGDTVLIEDRGVAVAQLAPVTSSEAGADTHRLSRLQRQGVVRPLSGPSKRLLTPIHPKRTVSLSELVLADRRTGL